MVIIGGSAGSLEVIINLLPDLSPALECAITLILHRKSDADTASLADILSRKTTLPVIEAEEKEAICSGHIYIAPADYHLLFERDHSFSLDYSEKVNFSRPSIDVSFESAADVYGADLAAILLSGANNDGASGLVAVSNVGGKTIVQDPATADVDYMPQYAIKFHPPDLILAPAALAGFINSWSRS